MEEDNEHDIAEQVYQAAACNEIARLGLLLKRRPDLLDALVLDSMTPLMAAAANGGEEAASVLLDM